MARPIVCALLLALLAVTHSTPAPPPAEAPEPVAVAEAEATAALDEAALDEAAVEVEAEAVEVETAEAPSPPADTASVQYMVTNEMKAQLQALGYGAAEISQLQPERAAAIIARKIRKPTQGVPTGWNRGARGASKLSLSKFAAPAAGGLALVASIASLFLFNKPGSAAPPKLEDLVPVDDWSEPVSSSPYWIDRQLDKLEAWLKRKFNKGPR